MQTCAVCGRAQPEINRFCTYCGRRFDGGEAATSASQPEPRKPEELNILVLYGMVAALACALLFPPWETPPEQPPEFLGLRFILSPPNSDAVVSRMLLTIELVTIAIAGLYGAFLFRKK
jgi:hypothetical protein